METPHAIIRIASCSKVALVKLQQLFNLGQFTCSPKQNTRLSDPKLLCNWLQFLYLFKVIIDERQATKYRENDTVHC